MYISLFYCCFQVKSGTEMLNKQQWRLSSMSTFTCIYVFLWHFMQLSTSLERCTIHRREASTEKFLQANNCKCWPPILAEVVQSSLITDWRGKRLPWQWSRWQEWMSVTPTWTSEWAEMTHLSLPLPCNLFIKPFVYEGISHRKLSALFPNFFPTCVLFRCVIKDLDVIKKNEWVH